MDKHTKKIASAMILMALALVIYISNRWVTQADFTDGKIYTLSEASENIVRNLDDPMTLRFYFSRSLKELPIWLKNYATQVEDLLKQYENASDGKLVVEFIDPEPDTEKEEEAIRAGIDGRRITGGDRLFFGLQAIQADQEKNIPMFMQDRERFLEYDISQLIYQTQQLEKPKLGVITSLAMFGGPPPNGDWRNARREWMAIQELRKTYDVEQITGNEIDEDVDVLAVIHPGSMNDEKQFAIDQFLLSGKPVFAAVDPSSFVNKQMGGQFGQPPTSNTSSDMPELLKGWGIDYSADHVIGDFNGARALGSSNGMPIQYPYFFSATKINDEISVTSTLRDVWLMEPGSFTLNSDTDLQLTPLIQTSDESGRANAFEFLYSSMGSIDELAKGFIPDNQQRTVAGIVQGKFKSAFPNGLKKVEDSDESEASDNEESLEAAELIADAGEAGSEEVNTADNAEKDEANDWLKSSKSESTLILVCDADFMANQLIGEEINFLGVSAFSLYNDNLAMVTNIVDQIGGHPELITLRGKGSNTRPFELIDNIRVDAQVRYQRQLDEFQSDLSQLESKIAELNKENSEQGRLVASEEARKAIEEYRNQEADIRKQIRLIRKAMRDDIEQWKVAMASFNIVPVPLLIGLFGLVYFTRRNRKY